MTDETATTPTTEATSSRFLSRKFILACVSQVGFTLLLWYGKIEPANYTTLTTIALGGYLGANILQKATQK